MGSDERDRRRAATEAFFAAEREKYRQEHIAIVLDAFKAATWAESKTWLELATVAVDSLLADGVVFARMGEWCDAEQSSAQ